MLSNFNKNLKKLNIFHLKTEQKISWYIFKKLLVFA